MIGSGNQRPSTAQTAPTSGGALGTGLLILGAVVAALIVLWLIVTSVRGFLNADGIVLGLVIMVVFAGPFIGAGWYLRRRGAAEQSEANIFMARRAVLDNDRVVRRELSRELEQRRRALLQGQSALPAAEQALTRDIAGRLGDLVQDVSRPGYDTSTWLEQTAAGMDVAQLGQLRRYDDLVLEEARRLETVARDLGRDPQAGRRLAENTDQLAQHIRERETLLGRGQGSTGLAPQELLAAGVAPRRRLETPLDLRLEDAVSYELDDFIVRGVLTYFAGTREWRVYQLHDGKQERWLDVRGDGADVTWYTLRPSGIGGVPGLGGDSGGGPVMLDGVLYSPAEAGSATVGVETGAGRRDGIFVEYQRFRGPAKERLTVERWPDGTRVLVGQAISRDDLELWTKPSPTE
jgi:hypothetical protein